MSFSPRLLAGRVGVVTGAGSPHGIGRSLVLGLAAAGARAVYATDLTTAHMASLRDEVQASGSHCSVHAEVFDVSSEEQTVAVVKRALADYGRLDFYFANAGMTGFRSLQETDGGCFDRHYAVMQRSVFLAVRYAGQAMSNLSADKTTAGGSIVVTSSMAGVSGAVADISYASVKAAASAMVKSAAVHLSATHVRVNAMAPGFVRTSIVATSRAALGAGGGAAAAAGGEGVDGEAALAMYDAAIGRRQGAGERPYYYHDRIAEPDEMAALGVFLASDLSASVNGQNIAADSGKSAAAFGESILGRVGAMKPMSMDE